MISLLRPHGINMTFRIDRPVLQVALDFTDLQIATRVAEYAIEGGADWLECGTPLIKSLGVKAVRVLKSRFRNTPIVADMKTMDTGRLESELAFNAGADVVSVLGVADDSTIREAVKVAREYDRFIMVDLINHPHPTRRAKQLTSMGVDIVLVHVGIDQQTWGADPLELLSEIAKTLDSYLAVAGGLDHKRAAAAVEMGADIVIVGRYITRADDIVGRARMVKNAIMAVLDNRHK